MLSVKSVAGQTMVEYVRHVSGRMPCEKSNLPDSCPLQEPEQPALETLSADLASLGIAEADPGSPDTSRDVGPPHDRGFWLAAALQLAPGSSRAWRKLSDWLFGRSGCGRADFIGVPLPSADGARDGGPGSGTDGALALQALAAGCQALKVTLPPPAGC